MRKLGFDNNKYLAMQSDHIRERISQFGDKLYLEFGGLPSAPPISRKTRSATIWASPTMWTFCGSSTPLRTGGSMWEA